MISFDIGVLFKILANNFLPLAGSRRMEVINNCIAVDCQ